MGQRGIHGIEQAATPRMGAFEMDGKLIPVPVKTCGLCAGTGEVEDFDDHIPPLVDAVEFRREQYGWTSMRMAVALGLAKSHYSEFVHGKRNLPLEARIKAYAIGVPAAVLLQEQV